MGKKKKELLPVFISVLAFAALFVSFFFPTIKEFLGSGSIKEPTVITELNQPYEGGVRVQVTDIKTVNALLASSETQTVVCVKLDFENISGESLDVSANSIYAYVDNVAVTQTVDPTDPYNFFAVASLLPGKRGGGYYCVYAPKDAKQIEINFKEDYFSKLNVTFVFDIPPVEG